MSATNVVVKKDRPRNRKDRDPIEGLFKVRISVTAAAKNQPESYLFVGSGKEHFAYRGQIPTHIWRSPNPERDIENYQKNIIGEISEFQSFLNFSPSQAIERVAALPGTAVKGNIRSRIELSFIPQNGQVLSCFVRGGWAREPPRRGIHGWRHHEIWKESLRYQRGFQCDRTREPTVCLVCDLFGAPGLASVLSFSTFYGPPLKNLQEISSGPQRLLAAPPGSTFTGTIGFKALKAEEVGLLLTGMGYRLQENTVKNIPVLFGFHKYRQFDGKTLGRVIYDVEEIHVSEICSGDEYFRPGTIASGEKRLQLIEKALKKTHQAFGNQLNLVNEPEKLIEVNKI